MANLYKSLMYTHRDVFDLGFSPRDPWGRCFRFRMASCSSRGERCWTLRYGPGAGYIGGWTFYLALNCVPNTARRYANPKRVLSAHTPLKIQVGLTRNANRVPYVRG